MYRKRSLKSAVSLILVTFVIFLIVSCVGVFAKGSIVENLNSVVYLDIPGGGGVSVGQELNVYKTIMYPQEHLAIEPSKGAQTGKVKITEIFDNRIAKAVVISGKAEKGDIVELVRSQ